MENTFSRRFFAPSINVEPSVKLAQENGETFHTMNFNFEVPIPQGEGKVALKFIFPEMPLEGSTITKTADGVELFFEGKVKMHSGEEWLACQAHYQVKLGRISEQLIHLSFVKKAELPCKDEFHEIMGELAL